MPVPALVFAVEREQPAAQALKDFVGAGEVGLGFLDYASHRLEDVSLRVHRRSYTRIDRYASQILPPSHANALEVARERFREPRAGIGERNWRPRVRPRNRRK